MFHAYNHKKEEKNLTFRGDKNSLFRFLKKFLYKLNNYFYIFKLFSSKEIKKDKIMIK